MKPRTTYRVIPILIGLGVLRPFSCTWWQYKKALDAQAQEAHQNFVNQEIHGRLEGILHPTGNLGEAVLAVSTTSANLHRGLLSIGLICIDDTFLLAVSEGDSIHKRSGSKVIRFSRIGAEYVEYEMRFCGPGAPQ